MSLTQHFTQSGWRIKTGKTSKPEKQLSKQQVMQHRSRFCKGPVTTTTTTTTLNQFGRISQDESYSDSTSHDSSGRCGKSASQSLRPSRDNGSRAPRDKWLKEPVRNPPDRAGEWETHKATKQKVAFIRKERIGLHFGT